MGRISAWAMAAAAALAAAVLLARTEGGQERLRTAFAAATPAPVAVHSPETERFSAALAQVEREIRHLSDAIDLLMADRTRLSARLEGIERGLEVTGSIAAAGTSGPPPQVWALDLGRPTPRTAPDSGLFWSPPAGGAADSIATTTEFGVDLGNAPTIEALRTRWTTLRSEHASLLAGLRPVVSIAERSGGIELRLVAGPLPNAAAAARLCGALAAAALPCQPAVFDGQRLALR
jgi:hypothetical protein